MIAGANRLGGSNEKDLHMINQKEGLAMPDQGTAVGGKGTDGKFYFLAVDSSGSIATVAAAGGATAAKQDTGNTSLASIDTKTPANGQATMAASKPVVIASDQTAIPITGSVTNVVSATTVVSTALEASHVLKASAGALVSLQIFNSKASAQYILVMNSATVPADGAVTLLCPPIYIAATTYLMLSFDIPLTASTGISVSNSSTGSFTKTIGAADCIFTGQVQ